jgi:hypothetical protein
MEKRVFAQEEQCPVINEMVTIEGWQVLVGSISTFAECNCSKESDCNQRNNSDCWLNNKYKTK